MPVFISYSHSDAEFVNKLAAQLVLRNAHIWVDSWELRVGDSILNRVQQAIQESSALLVVLSKASVASEWCKKELSAGLMRELDEKRVVVLPVLLEDCDIPMFLREKMYADFRKNFDTGMHALSEAIASATNIDQGRINVGNGKADWAEDWGYENGLFRLTYTLIEHSPELPFSLLTEIVLRCNGAVTDRYAEYKAAGLGWLGRLVMTEALVELADASKEKGLRVLLEDQFPQTMQLRLGDSRQGTAYDITVRCRRLGEDNGKDQLVDIRKYLIQIRDYMRAVARKPTSAELARFAALVGSRRSRA